MKNIPFEKPYFHPLDAQGLSWVKKSLEYGEIFSQLVLSEIDLGKGTVSILIASPDQCDAVVSGYPLDQATPETSILEPELQLQALLTKLRDLEKDMGLLSVIGEEDIAYPSNLLRELPNLPAIQYHDRYLYVKHLSDIQDGNELSYLISQPVGHFPNAFIVPRSIVLDTKIDHALAVKLARATVAIINTAFHFKTYTLWTRNTN